MCILSLFADYFAEYYLFELNQDVDEKLLYDTFSAFGVIVTNPKVIFPSVLFIISLLCAVNYLYICITTSCSKLHA